jgi:hypothetical protein
MDAKAHGALARGKPRSVSTTSGGFFAGGWGTPLHAPHFFVAAERRSFGRRAATASPKFARAARLFEALDGRDLTVALIGGRLAPSN